MVVWRGRGGPGPLDTVVTGRRELPENESIEKRGNWTGAAKKKKKKKGIRTGIVRNIVGPRFGNTRTYEKITVGADERNVGIGNNDL